MTPERDPAILVRFHLSLDQHAIGWWNSFEGLGMETAIEQREEGGENRFIHQLPTRLKYSNVKLSRPVNEDSPKVAAWFMSIANVRPTNQNACVQAVSGKDNKVVVEWNLENVVPVRWTGPSFNVESPKVATETLELAFHGFGTPSPKGA
jgi:phage tail-like protein